MWFVKSRRAQSVDDHETLVEGGVAPTLNSFDCGDTRATVVIAFDNSYRDGLRLQKGNTINTLTSKMGTGGNNVPFIDFASNQRSEVRDIGDVAVSLAAEPGTNQQTYIAQETTHDVIGTLQARSYKGPNHENARDGQLVIETETDMTDPTLSSDTQFGSNANVFEDVSPKVKASQQSPSIHHGMVVRRLTPVECERLMGWPDNHTLPRADGKPNSDTTRYKMCGNGVASPVAQWIGEQLMKITDGNR